MFISISLFANFLFHSLWYLLVKLFLLLIYFFSVSPTFLLLCTLSLSLFIQLLITLIKFSSWNIFWWAVITFRRRLLLFVRSFLFLCFQSWSLLLLPPTRLTADDLLTCFPFFSTKAFFSAWVEALVKTKGTFLSQLNWTFRNDTVSRTCTNLVFLTSVLSINSLADAASVYLDS